MGATRHRVGSIQNQTAKPGSAELHCSAISLAALWRDPYRLVIISKGGATRKFRLPHPHLHISLRPDSERSEERFTKFLATSLSLQGAPMSAALRAHRHSCTKTVSLQGVSSPLGAYAQSISHRHRAAQRALPSASLRPTPCHCIPPALRFLFAPQSSPLTQKRQSTRHTCGSGRITPAAHDVPCRLRLCTQARACKTFGV